MQQYNNIPTYELIDIREECRKNKDFKISDDIRDYLDHQLLFVFDSKDGPDIYSLYESYFKRKPENMSNRQYVEKRIKDDIRAEQQCDAWIYSIQQSIIKTHQ